jgi:poly(3-hydroxybutyrate) depolymerase
MSRALLSSCFVAIAIAAVPRLADAAEGELVVRPLSQTEAPYGHLEYVPVGYAESGHKHPVLIFLHGAGETGDGETNILGPMSAHGPAKLIAQGSTYFAEHEMLVFAPQSTEWWNPDGIHQFIAYLATNFRIDPRQVYLTGLSMGGGGTWSYVAGHPGRVSSAVPICGAAGPGDGTPFVGTPVWAFHAWSDPTVPSTNSIGWENAIADAIAMTDVADVLTGYPNQNGDPAQPAADDETAIFDGTQFVWGSGVTSSGDATLRLTLYPDGSHDSWTRTYERMDVWDWFVGQIKPPVLDDDRWIIDNLDGGFATSETAPETWSRSEATRGFYWWDYHQAQLGEGVTASFTTTELPPALYEVYVSWTPGEDRSTAIEAVIEGALEAPAPTTLDMTQGGGFTSLGVFTFDQGTGAVTLRGAAAATGLLVADAVGFVHRADLPAAESSGGADESSSDGGDDSDDGSSDETGPLGESGEAPGTDTTGAPAQDDLDASGCGCNGSGRAGGWLLAPLLLALRRRRTCTR